MQHTSHVDATRDDREWTQTYANVTLRRVMRAAVAMASPTTRATHLTRANTNGSLRGDTMPAINRRYRTRTRSKPPKRDTGIAKEHEIFDSRANEDEERERETSTSSRARSSTTRKRGVDRGEGGYQSRWSTMKVDDDDGRAGSSETRWEKCDLSGYKELGFEKSGFNADGETWWETWRETYCRDEYTGVEHLERSADKWARDAESKEWQEKWWERYYADGKVERGVEKSGREVRQAWWEKWGEQHDGKGATLKWTDKWAENGTGTRWGDKWEERTSAIGSGRKSGETWRVGKDGERWSRTWGEVISPNGSVRKFGQSTSGEKWDTTVTENVYFDQSKPSTWQETLDASRKLMSIEVVAEDDEDDKFVLRAPE